jgi:glycosyltransferase involved in cell wall biosynthesis
VSAPARKPLRIGIEAEVAPGEEGGIDQFLMALLSGLGPAGGQEYRFVARADALATVRRWAGDRIPVVSRPAGAIDLMERMKRALGPIRQPAGKVLRSASEIMGRRRPEDPPALPDSDGYFESLELDALHVPYIAHYQRTRVPVVLTLHDLQHRHFPEFFSPAQLAWREHVYPEAVAHARVVVTDCEWGRDDLVRQYAADPAKVKVVHLASPIRSYQPPTDSQCREVRRRLCLPERFALYPALTYGHKNHVRLLEAVAQLRDRQSEPVPLVCPGQQKLHWPVVRKRLEELHLEDQVVFPGFVSDADLRAMYRLARLVVFPSLFEGAGLPVLEALSEGTPLACSDIPAVREYAGGAARFFDPTSVDEIAEAIADVWRDADLRLDLAERGSLQAAQFSPDRMAAEYADAYLLAAEAGRRAQSAVTAEMAC